MKEIFLGFFFHKEKEDELLKICLLYTSDAADE